MKPRRWPDIVIVVAIVLLGGFGVWALWGEDLGLRGGRDRPPARTGPAATT
jgi:hypothetical protein